MKLPDEEKIKMVNEYVEYVKDKQKRTLPDYKETHSKTLPTLCARLDKIIEKTKDKETIAELEMCKTLAKTLGMHSALNVCKKISSILKL